MKSITVACFSLTSLASMPVRADEPSKKTVIESSNDLGFDIDFARGWAQRFNGRLVLNEGGEENRAEFHYGLAWKPHERFSVDLTAGYAYDHTGEAHHAFVVGLWKHVEFFDGKLLVRGEGLYRRDAERGRFDGFYDATWWIAGVHVLNRGKEAAAGFQIGSGAGLLPFRFDVRISFGLTSGMPDRIGCFAMSFDVR